MTTQAYIVRVLKYDMCDHSSIKCESTEEICVTTQAYSVGVLNCAYSSIECEGTEL